MPIHLTEKQKLLLGILAKAAGVYLVFRYLIPLVAPFLVAGLLALLIRPVVCVLHRRFRLPKGIGAALVLILVLIGLGTGIYFLGNMVTKQLVRLGRQLPQIWQQVYDGIWQFCRGAEKHLGLISGSLTGPLDQVVPHSSDVTGGWLWELLSGQFSVLVGSSVQGIITVGKVLFTLLVTLFVTIGATLITTTQLEELSDAVDRSWFRQEIQGILQTLFQVGKAYGKTQLVIMGCTVVLCGIGLTVLGDPYALLWAMAIGVVDALPLFGAGLILWPWMILSALRGRVAWTIGLAVIYGITNLTRQWLEARYMGDRIGLSALENLLAMYVGLQLFGILGLFLGPIGYLLIREPLRQKNRKN